ncbi:thiamine pyrophosphate-binding protein [candidate division WOR-1 bacterium RIFOXYD2_FULL_36_8]|nr:MAG: thiamine pyrophosphate-binding protein [candidate division WOR-1 bacterium RIFOXYD2_FULL_36_8]
MIKLSDYVIKFIADLKVKHIFILPGGGCMHLVDSIGKNKNIEFIGCLHEQAAAVAADGYAQYNGNIGVALVTTGPGGTNAITGVAASWIDSTPLLVLSGQTKRSDLLKGRGVRQMGIQEVDIVSIVKPITKYAVTVLDPGKIRYYLEKAVYTAQNDRPGPVWLDIPLDVQGAMIDENNIEGFIPPKESEKNISSQLVKQVITFLNDSKRPVILAGRGIRLGKANAEFLKVSEMLKIPVLTTWRLMDILPEEHELFFGRPGSIASRYANFVQQNADFILVLGARLDLPQVGHNYPNFASHAKKVMVDIDENEIKKVDTKIDIPIVADIKAFLEKFIQKLDEVEQIDRSSWIVKCKEWKDKYPIALKEYFELKNFVNTYALIDTLSNLMNSDDLLVPESSGSAAEITPQAFKVKQGQRILNSPGLGSMGFGIPQSIGACLASGKKRTVCIIGDGGLQHNIQEFETLKRLELPIKVFVLNNNGYAAIRNTHSKFFEGRLVCCDPSSGLTFPDTCKVASAYGLQTMRISSQKHLREDVQNVLNMEGTVICEVMVDPDLQMAPKLASKAMPDGRMVSRPLEDLWPFLDEEEQKNNMIVESDFNKE